MKQANAVRVGNKVSLDYRGKWLAFDWYWNETEVFLATDQCGMVWAYSRKPVTDDKGFYISEGDEEHVHSYKQQVMYWQDSVVQYTIK